MNQDKAIVLFSGGQDSTTCLYWAKKRFDEVHTLSISYGQRHRSELLAAKEIRHRAGIPHANVHIVETSMFKELGDSALISRTVDPSEIRGEGGRVDAEMPQGLPTSFVPGRNLFFLAAAGALAVKLGIKHIVTGVCQTDYSGYPDCRREFIDAMAATLDLAMPSSAGPFLIHTPLMYLTKADTVRLAVELGVECMNALGASITCYEGEYPGCGECPACVLRAKGFAEAGYPDPAFAGLGANGASDGA